MNNQELLIDEITKIKNEYYSTSNKNVFFKSSQKQNCATIITDKMGINQMLDNTVFIITNTNKVYLDYTIFKLYATPDLFDIIIQKVIGLFEECIEKYGNFEVHINLNSFTISAYERYNQIISKFCLECLNNNVKFTINITNLLIYNTPNMIDILKNLIKPFIDQNISNKIIFFNKKESEKLISELLNQNFQSISL
jgi:hypothetical protein